MKYRHFKGGIYTHVCEATLATSHGEEGTIFIVYHDDKGRPFVRPKSEFFEQVEVPTPNGFGIAQRFQKIFCKVCGQPLDKCRAGHSQE